MAEFNWDKYENESPEFDWSKYESKEAFHPTDEAKSLASQQISQKFPKMPEFLRNALMKLANEEVEHPVNMGESSALGTFTRNAIRTPLETSENFANLIGLPTNKEAQWPDYLSQRESDKEHPIAALGGDILGFLAPGTAGVKAMRAIPAWGKIAEKAAPSFLRRAPVWGAEGAALGAAISPEGQRGEGALTGGLLGGAGAIIPSVAKGFKNLKERLSSLRNLDKLKEQGLITEEQYQKALADEEQLSQLAQHQDLGRNANDVEVNLPQRRNEANLLESEIVQTPEVNTQNMLPGGTGEGLIPEAQAHNESLLREGQAYLGHGQQNDVIFQNTMNQLIRQGRREIGSGYDAMEERFRRNNVGFHADENLRELQQALSEELGRSNSDPELAHQLANQLVNARAGQRVNAADLLTQFRTLDKLARNSSRRAFERNESLTEAQREAFENQARLYHTQAEQLSEILESQVDPQFRSELQDLNSRWSEYASLYRNPLGREIEAGRGISDSNIMHKMRGDETGQQLLRRLTMSHPEANRAAIGHTYAENPIELLNAPEYERMFIEQNNTLPSYLQRLQQGQFNEELANRLTQQRQQEAGRVERSFGELQKEQQQRAINVEKLTELNKKISDSENIISEMKKNAKQKNISLKRKIELEDKIKKAESDVKDLKRKLWQLGGIGLATGLGFKISNLFK